MLILDHRVHRKGKKPTELSVSKQKVITYTSNRLPTDT